MIKVIHRFTRATCKKRLHVFFIYARLRIRKQNKLSKFMLLISNKMSIYKNAKIKMLKQGY